MDGVILFVDDNVDRYSIHGDEIERSLENGLFEELRKTHPVLGVKSLDLAETVVNSVGSFSAIILDWIFDNRQDLALPDEAEQDIPRIAAPRDGRATLEFLQRNDFYSLVYILSNEDVKANHGSELRKRFKGRIKFRRKDAQGTKASKILKDIDRWREANEHLSVPTSWTCAVNQAFQRILFELAIADKNWVRELGKAAADDGSSGDIFVIEILQNLLSESLVQNKVLRNLLIAEIEKVDEEAVSDEKSVSMLFRRLYYTKLDPEAPIMTGDICKINSKKWGIIITPECDVGGVVKDEKRTFELLTFSIDSMDEFLNLQMNFEYSREKFETTKASTLKTLRGRFNNGEARFHVLPSFPFNSTQFNVGAVINLSTACERFTASALRRKRTYKLNSPFIQQLRQRYLAYLGRVGTPSLPPSVRNYNLRS